MTDRKTFTDANRAAWDASASHHGTGAQWQALLADAATPGFSTFDDCLTATLRGHDLPGKSTVQIGCNNGRELLSLATFGARPALGIDQSAAFLAQAAELAKAAGSDCRFLCADIYDLPPGLPQHDLALITIGVLNWMPDLPAFFHAVAGLMAPGARLVIYETHPFLEMFDPDSATPFAPTLPYFTTRPHMSDQAITYDGTEAGPAPASYWFTHTLGQIVSALSASGLRLDTLTEHPHSNREVDYDPYTTHDPQLPMCFTLTAQKG